MDEKRPLDIQTLGRWLEENKVSRTELASSLGLARSTIDNYFSKGSIPKHVQILISRYMQGREPASSNDFVSQLSVPIPNKILNLAVRAAVQKDMSVEEFVVWAVREETRRMMNRRGDD
ncbi:hypothetical protein [uncultured Akkermansia sp.]|uniref:hypothetical protein n=1 Tax=uncultured Akkermansia sp. TaxID=512294 RepID=UPI0026145885|nr:hypothetical protein [uncultured Akkermansia sp.]